VLSAGLLIGYPKPACRCLPATISCLICRLHQGSSGQAMHVLVVRPHLDTPFLQEERRVRREAKRRRAVQTFYLARWRLEARRYTPSSAVSCARWTTSLSGYLFRHKHPLFMQSRALTGVLCCLDAGALKSGHSNSAWLRISRLAELAWLARCRWVFLVACCFQLGSSCCLECLPVASGRVIRFSGWAVPGR